MIRLKTALLAALLAILAYSADAQVATQNALTSGGIVGNCAIYTGPVTIGPTACGGGSGGAVSSVFGRTGAVTAQSGDYSITQITGPGSWTNGQVPIGSTSDGFLHPATLTAGTNVTIVNSPAGITISSTAAGTGCIPGGTNGQVLSANGSGGCTSNAGLNYSAGTLTTGVVGATQGSLDIAGATSGTAIITTGASNGSPTITLGTSSGTPAVTASSPLVITTATGNITCPTCTTNASAATLNQLMIGGGAQAIGALGSAGSATTVLHGGSPPSFSAVNLANDVTSLLSGANMAVATTSTFGAVETSAGGSHQWVSSWSAGIPQLTQPSFGDLLGTFSSAQCIQATTSAFGCVKPDGSSITVVAGVISAPGSGGGTVNSGTQSQVGIYFGAGTTTAIKGYSFGNTFTVDNANLAVYSIAPDNPYSANHTITATDMGALMPLTSTATLTFPAISAGPPPIFAIGQNSCYTNVGSQNWTVATSPTINGLKSTTVYPSGWGCVNSNGTSLDWMGVAGDEARLNAVNTWGAAQTFPDGDVKLSGSSSGTATLHAPAAASTNSYVLPTAAGTLVGSGDSGTVTGTMIASATVAGANIVSSAALAGSPTTTTQSAKTNSTTIATTAYVDRPTGLTTGTSITLAAPRQYFECTSTCTITLPVPAAGYEFCVRNANNVSTVITFSNPGSSVQFEKTAWTSYGTATTGTAVSGGAAGDKLCIVGKDATHYDVFSFVGTWTMS